MMATEAMLSARQGAKALEFAEKDAADVYKAFREACDSLFRKRDESRDAEANAWSGEAS